MQTKFTYHGYLVFDNEVKKMHIGENTASSQMVLMRLDGYL